MHDHLLGNRSVQPDSQSSRSELLDVRSHRPPENPKLPRRGPPRLRRPLWHVSARADRHLRNELLKSRLCKSPRTRPSGPQSSRIQSASCQHSRLLKTIRLLRSLPTRKGYLRRRPPPLHLRIRPPQSRRKIDLSPQL